ncbi:hypothetical protein KY284_012322 [Solanum tuberosum]|nr:hypothetical protein KY284_012322 [Solanum tuberosum]
MKGKQQHNRLSFVLILKPSSCLLVFFCNGGVFIAKGGSKVVVEPHRHGGVFIAKGNKDDLCTKNLVPGEAVYNKKRIYVQNEDGTKVEYRVWNPFLSKSAAAILGGVGDIWILGNHVLYLGVASGTTVSHVSNLVGPEGVVFIVEFSHRSGRDLVNMAKKRTNVIPIIQFRGLFFCDTTLQMIACNKEFHKCLETTITAPTAPEVESFQASLAAPEIEVPNAPERSDPEAPAPQVKVQYEAP